MFVCSAIRSCYSRGGDSVVGAHERAYAVSHLQDHLFGDRVVKRLYVEDACLDVVGVRDHRPAVECRAAGMSVEEHRQFAAGATLGRRDSLTALFEQLADQHLYGLVFGGEEVVLNQRQQFLYLRVHLFRPDAVSA